MAEWQDKLRQWACMLPEPVAAQSICVQYQDPSTLGLSLGPVAQATSGQVVVVTADCSAAESATTVLSTFFAMLDVARTVTHVPEVSSTEGRAQWVPENEASRCAALDLALSDSSGVFVMSAATYVGRAVTPEAFASHTISLRSGETQIAPEELAARLVALDYDNEFEVHVPGEFSRRGGILDIYSPLYDAPVRIEFFGDEVDSMRFFLPDTQRSFREIDEIRIVPRGAIVAEPEAADVADVATYFGEDALLAVCEPQAISEHLDSFADEATVSAWNAVMEARGRRFVLVSGFASDKEIAAFGGTVVRSDAIGLGEELGTLLPELGDGAALWHWQQLREHLVRWTHQGYAIVACCAAEGEFDRLQEMLAEDPDTARLSVVGASHSLEAGVLIPSASVVLLSARELFGRHSAAKRRRRGRYRFEVESRDDGALEEGSFAVHASHGVCIYHGIKQLEVHAEVQEVMELEFAEEARLYVPLEQAHLVSRYIGGRKRLPSLNRLGTAFWKKAKDSAADAAWDLAAELLRLEALRKGASGFSFPNAGDWEDTFAQSFPYSETADQSQAISDVLEDMALPEPMDRLLCGDVGYGKTEVSMRAAFRAVLHGKQVAVLVPTTVLAQQHYATFRERMAEYPIGIDVISRFRSRAEQRSVLERVATGQVDIIIGTHRLLQKDVFFHDLGLLIIDEEQRFGVQHKQRLKEMRASIDILTMTATPIPRTLYFSLSGIRHLSTIMTAPAERLPVTTVVAQYDPELIKRSILRELERNGQVYFLHNRVQTIDRIAQHIGDLVPRARLGVGHGQMEGDALERVMGRFTGGEIDVLVCTTIIESGLDIPNANTIIIDRADRFGLADLYQLRGRVGRYHRQAYAYLLLPPMGSLPQNVRDRLSAIRRYTHLGAGFKLALRDLEIRGAGNILGTEQSGHIAAVGFDLYCKLLREAVARLERRPLSQHAAVHVSLDRVTMGLGSRRGSDMAALPPEYVGAESVRLGCYRRITEMSKLEEVDEFEQELADRFGPPPKEVSALLEISRIRVLAAQLDVHSVVVHEQCLVLETRRGLVKGRDRKLPRLQTERGHAQIREVKHWLVDRVERRREFEGETKGGRGTGSRFA
ncbi:MAG: transcription-repair coupling factor [Lentisphaerae bacterium]|jgi:transcription-repair coupling factor (superfamily II helicase)|nr:transcription-repair coupling factor [Lentisphaerota bacterium]MBT4821481.1 transcription-repair coupling factor [Lentisphaerota bacterium]MBT5608896.1 transcription-repair coupling factor [Lentisphaerota bacterium]MBT7057392.1 transcription-repair coupling factor [Lentisphaerota bacterium]MBT7842762.1 transcription-repair coupling factor [Lentisphaerota bacterium]